MPNYNKNKGKNLEREVAKELTEVFGWNFTRVPNSGAFTGGMNFHRVAQLTREQNLLMCGDIIMPMQLEHVTVECKFYKSFSFQSLFDNNETLNGWIEQAKGSTGKLWFLIFKINNCGKFVVFDKKDETLFSSESNRCIYKNAYVVTSYDGFFVKNKEAILQYSKECLQQSNSTTTTLLSTSTP